MKLPLLIFISLMICANVSYANCSGQFTQNNRLDIREDFILNPTQTESYANTFTDTTCTNLDTIKHATGDNSDIIVGLYDDSVRLKLRFNWLNPGDISLSDGTRTFSGAYKVDVSLADNASRVDISAGSGNSVTINDIALMSSANKAVIWQALLKLGGCLISGQGWQKCAADFREFISRDNGSYAANLLVSYNRKLTTCEPKNLTLDLPPVSISQLTLRGEVKEPAVTGDIVLDCKNSVSDPGKTTRDITVSLESDLLSAGGDNTVLTPVAGGGSGVGFQLKNNNGDVIKINQSGLVDERLKTFAKGDVIKPEERIPVTARYYVIDPDNLQSGKITSNAIIKVTYP